MRVRFSLWRRTAITVLLAGIFFTVLAVDNPYDKFRNRQLSNKGYLSEQDELQLAAEVHKELLKKSRLVEDPAINGYINSLGQRLARRSARPDIPYHFFVVDDKTVNAFATLGGYVYLHTGLIRVTESESQLASVMGHEIGHIAARHGLENVKRAQKYGTLAGIAQIAGAVIGGTAGGLTQVAGNMVAGGFLMKHSRDAEREADYLGLYNLQRSGYSTSGMIEMFEILNHISGSNPDMLGSIMASHPPAREREANTRLEIDEHLSGSDRRGQDTTPDFQRIKARFGGNTAPPPPRRVRPRP
jgi:predicted Zn-dependent protease